MWSFSYFFKSLFLFLFIRRYFLLVLFKRYTLSIFIFLTGILLLLSSNCVSFQTSRYRILLRLKFRFFLLFFAVNLGFLAKFDFFFRLDFDWLKRHFLPLADIWVCTLAVLLCVRRLNDSFFNVHFCPFAHALTLAENQLHLV